MLRALSSSLFSLLLVSTLLWGGCVSCEQYFMPVRAHGCCGADGRCKTTKPAKSGSGATCNQIAFDHQKTIDVHFEVPVTVVRRIEIPVPGPVVDYGRAEVSPIDPSPPDLQILHCIYLI